MASDLIFEDELVRVTDCYIEYIPKEISPCFGLRLDSVDGKSMVFSGDTAPCERLVKLARGATHSGISTQPGRLCGY